MSDQELAEVFADSDDENLATESPAGEAAAVRGKGNIEEEVWALFPSDSDLENAFSTQPSMQHLSAHCVPHLHLAPLSPT